MKFKQLSTTKVSAIFQEPDDTKRDGMIDMLTEDEAKMLCKCSRYYHVEANKRFASKQLVNMLSAYNENVFVENNTRRLFD